LKGLFLSNLNTSSKLGQSIFWIFLWGFAHSVTMAIAKTLPSEIQTTVIVFVRNIFGAGIITTTIFLNKNKFKISNNLPLHFIRVLLGTSAMLCTYYAYRNLNLSVATSIGFTTPLISSLFAIFFLKEKLTTKKILALSIGYLGIVFVAQPKFSHNSYALVIALLANLTSSLSLVCAKKLTKNESSLQILAHYQIGTLIIATILFFYNNNNFNLEQSSLIKLFFIATIAVFSQYCYVQSLKYAELSFVAPFEYVRIIYANAIGYYIFFEKIDLYDLIGCGLIIIASLILSREKITK